MDRRRCRRTRGREALRRARPRALPPPVRARRSLSKTLRGGEPEPVERRALDGDSPRPHRCLQARPPGDLSRRARGAHVPEQRKLQRGTGRASPRHARALRRLPAGDFRRVHLLRLRAPALSRPGSVLERRAGVLSLVHVRSRRARVRAGCAFLLHRCRRLGCRADDRRPRAARRACRGRGSRVLVRAPARRARVTSDTSRTTGGQSRAGDRRFQGPLARASPRRAARLHRGRPSCTPPSRPASACRSPES